MKESEKNRRNINISPLPLLGCWPVTVYTPRTHLCGGGGGGGCGVNHSWPAARGNFVDHVFLKAYYLASILQHVSYLAMGALPSNNLLHSLPLQTV